MKYHDQWIYLNLITGLINNPTDHLCLHTHALVSTVTGAIAPFVRDQFLGTGIYIAHGLPSFRILWDVPPMNQWRMNNLLVLLDELVVLALRQESVGMRKIFISCAVACFNTCTTCTLLTTEQLQKLPFALKYCCAWRFYSAELPDSASG